MPPPRQVFDDMPRIKKHKKNIPLTQRYTTRAFRLTASFSSCLACYTGRKGTQFLERPLGSPLLALLRHLSESLHTSGTKRSVIGVSSSVKGALGGNGVAGREINHASPIATAHRSKHPLTLGITSGLGRSLRQGKLRALLAALSQLGSPVTWC